jgi:ribose 5-phosphate isomerase RpiB
MIVTARQVQDLHRQSGGNGQVTLPYRARLTPLASDWIRSKKLLVGYSDVAVSATSQPGAGTPGSLLAGATGAAAPGSEGKSTAMIRWWCDGPCGPAKAAIVSLEKQSSFAPLDVPADARHLSAAIKAIATQVRSGQASGGVIMVHSGAAAVVLANRCPSLRAVLGTCLDAVEQGLALVAANVLVIEYPYQTLQQTKNLLSRFARGIRPGPLPAELARQLQELATCA